NLGKGQVETAGQPLLDVAVDAKAWDASGEVSQKGVSEAPKSFRFFGHFGAGNRRRAAEPDAERRWQGPRAQAALLAAAIDQRQQSHPRPTTDVERADTFGPIYLVAGNRQQVDLHSPDIERDLAEGLRRIGVEQHALGAAQCTDLGERLNDPDPVVR